jgi:hypothetical protein
MLKGRSSDAKGRFLSFFFVKWLVKSFQGGLFTSLLAPSFRCSFAGFFCSAHCKPPQKVTTNRHEPFLRHSLNPVSFYHCVDLKFWVRSTQISTIGIFPFTFIFAADHEAQKFIKINRELFRHPIRVVLWHSIGKMTNAPIFGSQ